MAKPKRKTKQVQTTITFYLPQDTRDAFRMLAEMEGMYMSEKLRHMIVNELAQWGREHGLTSE